MSTIMVAPTTAELVVELRGVAAKATRNATAVVDTALVTDKDASLAAKNWAGTALAAIQALRTLEAVR